MENMSKSDIINAVIEDYRFLTPYKVDKRKRTYKQAVAVGVSESQIIEARRKRIKRNAINVPELKKQNIYKEMRSFLEALKNCEFCLAAQSSRYNTTGIDWGAYHRPSSNGLGWVIICPDEPANNWYIEHLGLVRILTKKYIDNDKGSN